jgi:spore germination protein GerM
MSGTWTRWAGASAVAAVVVLTAACGVSTNDEPQPIARDRMPSDLLDSQAGSAVDPTAPGQDVEVVPLWYLKEDSGSIQLHALDRGIASPAEPSRRIDALLDPARGPTEAERRDGVSTAIPSDARLTAVPIQDGSVLEVSLSDDFYAQGGNTFIYAVAQLVYTATGTNGVEAVRFMDEDGDRIEVQDSAGESHDEPVGRDDYANLAPPELSGTTTTDPSSQPDE